MAELDYAGLVVELETKLRAVLDPDVYVTQELDEPNASQMPMVRLILVEASRTPRQIVALQVTGQPDEVLVTLQAECWAYSAESAADAARQRDALVAQVVNALRANDPTLGGRVQYCLPIGRVLFRGVRDGETTFQAGVITVQARALT